MHHGRFPPALLIGAFVLAVTGAAAAPAETPPGPDPLITNVDARRTTSLDGAWPTIVDALERGYYDYRYQPRADGYFRDQKPGDETDRVEYAFDTSPTLQVPGDWNTQRDSLLYYEGTIWYRRLFDDPREGPGSRLFVWSPHRVLPGVQDGWNRKGVVSDRGQRKQAFFVLQEWYRSLEADPAE